jgi:hypothetical protein
MCTALCAVFIFTTSAISSPIFDDDFQTGINPGVWVLHDPGGGTWIHATEGENGYVTSPPQNPLHDDNRVDHMLTVRDDFGDFEMTWHWRFGNEGLHKARRYVHFRAETDRYPLGYWLNIAVNDPPKPHPTSIFFTRLDADTGEWHLISDYLDYPWQLDHWYSFRLQVSGYNFKVKFWSLGDPEPLAWNLETQDPEAMFAQGRIGFGDYWQGVTDADNVVVQDLDAIPPPFPIRNPQVPLNGSELQAYLDGVGESVNVYGDQLAAQVCSTSVSGNAGLTLMVELSGHASENSVGIYNADCCPPFHGYPEPPPVCEVFPQQAGPGWAALVMVQPPLVVVNLFDETGVLQGQTECFWFTEKLGLYLDNPTQGRLYSQDSRNHGGIPQAVMYAGTGRNWGEVWLCWEDSRIYPGSSDRDFNDVVLLLQSLVPVPGVPTTWGSVKARYR